MPATENSPSPGLFLIRPIESRDLDWVREELIRNWGSTQIASLGRWYDADALPGFIAAADNEASRLGLLTHTLPDPRSGCEVITLSTRQESRGVGTALLAAAAQTACAAGCTRLYLTTTNDNLRAIGFYQKRDWRLVAIHRGAMDAARRVKPEIPLVGMNGIPLRDEIELELRLQ